MGAVKRYGRFTLCEGYGRYFDKRCEIWEDTWHNWSTVEPFEKRWDSRLGIALIYWGYDKDKCLEVFEKIKDEPLIERSLGFISDDEELPFN